MLDIEHFDFEHEDCIGRDAIRDTNFSIAKVRTDFHLSFTSPSHPFDAVVYPRNDLPPADNNLSHVVFLNLLALVQPTVQTDLDGIAFFDGITAAFSFRKKLDTRFKHHVAWHVSIYARARLPYPLFAHPRLVRSKQFGDVATTHLISHLTRCFVVVDACPQARIRACVNQEFDNG